MSLRDLITRNRISGLIKGQQAPTDRMMNITAAVDIAAAPADAEGKPDAAKPREFSMVAYTGGLLRLGAWYHPVVVDLQGLNFSAPMTMLGNHQNDPDWVAGTASEITVEDNQLVIAGQVFPTDTTPMTQKIARLSAAGMKWQASIGAEAVRVEFLAPGKKAQVNGQTFTGPCYIARQSNLRETSFVVLGADAGTSANVAASQTPEQAGDSTMTFNQWLTAKGFDPEIVATNESQEAFLKAAWQGEGKPADQTPADDNAQDLQAQIAEMRRENQIARICAGQFPDLEAEALKEGWSVDVVQAKVETARAQQQIDASYAMPAIHAGTAADAPNPTQVVEAALCITGGMATDEAVDGFSQGERIGNEAVSARFQGFGLANLLHASAAALGVAVRPGQFNADSIRALMEAHRDIRAAGVTTMSLPGILSNVANKRLMKAYRAVPQLADRLSAIATPSDLKAYTVYSLFGDGTVQPVGPDGKLKHITLQETSYSNKAHTEGGIMVLTEDMMINDDLGAFLRIPQTLGRACAVRKESAFFTTLLAIANFFTAGNGNYIDGADSALSIAALSTAGEKFALQTDPNGDPVAVTPKFLLTTVGDSIYARQLHKDTTVNETTTANKPKPTSNPHAGMYDPVSSPYMNTTKVDGSATNDKHWLMLADPADVPVLELAYVRGQRAPRIERGTMDFDQLAVGFRCVFRFGFGKADYRGGLYSKGKA